MTFVPMTEDAFRRQRMRKFYIWGSAILAVALVVVLAIWKSSQPATAHNDYDAAVNLYNSGHYRESIVALDRAIAGRGHVVEAYRLRGTAHRLLNDTELALADLNKVIEAEPSAIEDYRQRAECYRQLGQLENALRDYDFVLDRKPDADTYNGRGICYRDLKRVDRAIADFSKAIELRPTVDNYLQRGMAYDSMGDHVKAIADFDRVIETRPEMPYTYRARAFAKEALGDRAGANADREKARAIEYPNRPAPAQKPPRS